MQEGGDKEDWLQQVVFEMCLEGEEGINCKDNGKLGSGKGEVLRVCCIGGQPFTLQRRSRRMLWLERGEKMSVEGSLELGGKAMGSS